MRSLSLQTIALGLLLCGCSTCSTGSPDSSSTARPPAPSGPAHSSPSLEVTTSAQRLDPSTGRQTPRHSPQATHATSAPATVAVSPDDYPPGALPPASCFHAGPRECEKRCENSDPDACGTLALLLANGWQVQPDPRRAVALATDSCNRHSPIGCGMLGSFVALGVGGAKDPERARELFTFACENGDALSCESLGGQAIDPASPPLDLPRAAKFFLRACDLGHVRACLRAAATIQDGELEPHRDPLELYSRACDSGFPLACVFLGESLRSDASGQSELDRATAAFARACRLGHSAACSEAK